MSIEMELDKLLKIKTSGRDDSKSNFVNYPYEATPYSVLQALSNSGYIAKSDKLIDFGCGKGRVGFYLAFYNKCKVIGVEYDPRLYNSAIENHKRAVSSGRVEFINANASDYIIEDDVTCVYFFNPFSIQVLKDVIKNLRSSLERNYREIKLFFYYPSDEYLDLLSNIGTIRHIEDIDLKYLFKNNDRREKLAIYEL